MMKEMNSVYLSVELMAMKMVLMTEINSVLQTEKDSGHPLVI